jgi:hypothetical protein
LLPSISTIERASSAGRARARKQAAHALIADLSAEQVQALDQLFGRGGAGHLALLKTIPVAAKPDHVRQILDRLRQVRKIGISPTSRAASTRTDFGNMSGRPCVACLYDRALYSLRRRATLVAFLLDLEERLTDSALEMADKLIGGIFTRAKNAQARSYAATSKNVARLMLIFRRTIDALTDAVDTGEDPMEVLDASVGWHTLLKARPEVATIAETANLDPLGSRPTAMRRCASSPLICLKRYSSGPERAARKRLPLSRCCATSIGRASAICLPTLRCPSARNGRKSSWAMTARSIGGSGKSRLSRICATSCAPVMSGWNDRRDTASSTATC